MMIEPRPRGRVNKRFPFQLIPCQDGRWMVSRGVGLIGTGVTILEAVDRVRLAVDLYLKETPTGTRYGYPDFVARFRSSLKVRRMPA